MAAYVISIMQRINVQKQQAQVLIPAPTRGDPADTESVWGTTRRSVAMPSWGAHSTCRNVERSKQQRLTPSWTRLRLWHGAVQTRPLKGHINRQVECCVMVSWTSANCRQMSRMSRCQRPNKLTPRIHSELLLKRRKWPRRGHREFRISVWCGEIKWRDLRKEILWCWSPPSCWPEEVRSSGDQGHLLAASTMSCQPGEKHKSMLPLVDLW